MIATNFIILTLVAASLAEPISPNLARRCGGHPMCTPDGEGMNIGGNGLNVPLNLPNILPVGPFGSGVTTVPGCLNQAAAINIAALNSVNCFNNPGSPINQLGGGIGGGGGGFTAPVPGSDPSLPVPLGLNPGVNPVPTGSFPGDQFGNNFPGGIGLNSPGVSTFGLGSMGAGVSCANQAGLVNLSLLNQVNCGNNALSSLGVPGLSGINLKGDNHKKSDKKA